MLKIVIALVAVTASCAVSTFQTQDQSAPSSASPIAIESPVPDKSICDLLAQIRATPFFKSEKGVDAAYDSLIEAGDKALPCLIERVTDTTPMNDPRPSPKYRDFRIGDLAYFMILHITETGFEQLPPDVQESTKQEGVWAYFRHVEDPENRKRLQDRLHVWYQRKYKTGAVDKS